MITELSKCTHHREEVGTKVVTEKKKHHSYQGVKRSPGPRAHRRTSRPTTIHAPPSTTYISSIYTDNPDSRYYNAPVGSCQNQLDNSISRLRQSTRATSTTSARPTSTPPASTTTSPAQSTPSSSVGSFQNQPILRHKLIGTVYDCTRTENARGTIGVEVQTR